MSALTIYTKVGCPYCAAALKHYTEQGRSITEIDVNNTPGAKEKVLELSGGQSIVPLIIDNGKVLVGFGGG